MLPMLGDAIRTLRAAADLSQRELARRAGYHDTLISMIERGARNPSRPVLANIAEALGVEADLLEQCRGTVTDAPDRVGRRVAAVLRANALAAPMGGGR